MIGFCRACVGAPVPGVGGFGRCHTTLFVGAGSWRATAPAMSIVECPWWFCGCGGSSVVRLQGWWLSAGLSAVGGVGLVEGVVVDGAADVGLVGGFDETQVVDAGSVDRCWRLGFDVGVGVPFDVVGYRVADRAALIFDLDTGQVER